MKKTVLTLGSLFAVAFSVLAPEVAMAADAPTIGDIGTKLADNASGLGTLIYNIALLSGIGLIVYSLFAGFAASKPQSQTSWKTVILAFIFGSALVSITVVVGVGSKSMGVNQDDNATSFLKESKP